MAGEKGTTLTLGSISFLVNGKQIPRPSPAQLAGLLQEESGSWHLVITPAPVASAASVAGSAWFLPFQNSPGNTAQVLARCIQQRPLDPATSPLLTAGPGVPLTQDFLDHVLSA